MPLKTKTKKHTIWKSVWTINCVNSFSLVIRRCTTLLLNLYYYVPHLLNKTEVWINQLSKMLQCISESLTCTDAWFFQFFNDSGEQGGHMRKYLNDFPLHIYRWQLFVLNLSLWLKPELGLEGLVKGLAQAKRFLTNSTLTLHSWIFQH